MTGSPASIFSVSPQSTASNHSSPQSSPELGFASTTSSISINRKNSNNKPTSYPLTPSHSFSSGSPFALPSPVASAPRQIPSSNAFNNKFTNNTLAHGLATPPITPSDSPRSTTGGGRLAGVPGAPGTGSVAGLSHGTAHDRAALDFLATLFPKSALSALQHARSVHIQSAKMVGAFNGVVLDLPGRGKTLYVDGKGAENIRLRDRCGVFTMNTGISQLADYTHLVDKNSIVALLDLASEHLNCTALVIALERSSPTLGELLHSLMYVGGSVVTKPPFPVDEAFVLVGMEV